MTTGWTSDDLDRLGRAPELEIAVRAAEGGLGRWTPIWVVVADGEVLVRTWVRQGTGWYGAAMRTGVARVRLPGWIADVGVEPADDPVRRPAVDAAYRSKHGAGAVSMTTDEAAASTLRLVVER